MNNFLKVCSLAAFGLLAQGAAAETIAKTTGPDIIQLSELEGLSTITYLDGQHCYANKATSGNPIRVMGNEFESGVGTHAPSVAVVELNGASSFYSIIGVDDAADSNKDNHGVFEYVVTLYGQTPDATTEVKRATLNRQEADRADTISIADLSGYRYLKLEVKQGTQAWADHADWADARFTYSGTAPALVAESGMYPELSVELPAVGPNGEEIVALSSLDLSLTTVGWGTVRADKSINNNPIMLKGVKYASGVGTHASAKIVVKLNGAVTEFHCVIGIDDEVAQNGNVDYDVRLRGTDGQETSVASGNVKRTDTDVARVDLTDISGYRYLIIDLDDNGGDAYDHVDVANAYFTYVEQNSSKPEMVNENAISTKLDAATLVFSQPGVRFMQKLRCSNPDAVISVSGLPAGLTYNADRKLIEGTVDAEGEYTYTANVSFGEESQNTDIKLTVSSNLKMPTPLMGWLSWNVVEGNISNAVVESVADNMEKYGLIKAGYDYLIIDDLWHAPSRAADGYPREDPNKFPKGIKAASDYVHAKGMKFGNYSDVADHTCAHAYGSLGYEDKDAEQYAKWGVDLVKVDFCGQESQKAPRAQELYQTFATELDKYDITLYMCEWGQREPWLWGAETGAPLWRATYDTRDCWNGKNGGVGIIQSIAGMKDIYHYNGVNRWNDADMMCVAIHGTGKSSSAAHLCATGPGMTQDEYATQFALWCMWSSPLTLSFDLSKPISDDDLAMITNADLIAIDQDPMGQAGEPIQHDADFFVLQKDLENGDVAISVTNLSSATKSYTFDFSKFNALDPQQEYTVRDLQKGEACPNATGSLTTSVPSHATAVYRLSTGVQTGINAATVAAELEKMTATRVNDTCVNVCLPGTQGADKRVLLSDVEGRVVASATTADECITLPAPAKGIYVVNAISAARSHSLKLAL